MFDITKANIDHGHGHCKMSGHHGVFCGNHCPTFNTCSLRNKPEPEEMVMVKMVAPNGATIEIPMTTKEKMQYAYHMGSLMMGTPVVAPKETTSNVEKAVEEQVTTTIEENKVEEIVEEELEEKANETAATDNSVNELIENSGEEEIADDDDYGYVGSDVEENAKMSIPLPIISSDDLSEASSIIENDKSTEENKKKTKKNNSKEFTMSGGKTVSNKGYGNIKFTRTSL